MYEDSRSIIINDFYSEELDNYRSIRIYLPRSYDSCPDKSYPVLYMHDGQNLFDPSDSLYKASWNVDKAADKLVMEGKIQEIIIVGIDNNTNRAGEYCHFMPEGRTLGRMGFRRCEAKREARGISYEKFIINSLKPYIDTHFRTLKDRENTALMGSSLGGLVTYFIGFRHPEVFGKLGIVSPAFNWADFDKLQDIKKEPLKIWMDTGEGEAYYVDNTRRVVNALLDKGFISGKDLAYYQVPDAIHNEEYWAKRVYLPLLFFFGDTGKPISCRLAGRSLIGMKGMKVTVNPLVQYDSGFLATDIDGRFVPENPDIMEIMPNGQVIPKACGETKVSYENDGVKDTVTYTVIEELSETVNVELNIKVPANTPPQEKIYVNAGEFIEAQKDDNGEYKCTLTVPRDWGYYFNIFLGDAHINEVDNNGMPARNKIFQATEDMKVQYKVGNWASANRQSKILTISDFYASKLDNYRNIYIYLPPDYDRYTDKRYPVLYMQDGQNIFTPSASSSGSSWNIHNTADKLISEGKIREIIIVGIEFKERGKEYAHYSCNRKKVEWNEYARFEYTVEGKGLLYEDFVINELKPYIDKNFRTLPDKDYTALMGASAGGFVTFNIGIRHPDIFGMLGIISPAFFGMDFNMLNGIDKKPLKLWFEIGEMEPCLLEDTKRVVDLLMAGGYIEGKELIYYQVPQGFHSDKDWGERAGGPLTFFFGDMGQPIHAVLTGRNVIGLEENAVRINPLVYYSSGLIRSDLSASYHVENHEILEIKPDGTILPMTEGTSRVDYVLNNIIVSNEYRIMKDLSQTVTVDIEVRVPDNTPKEAGIFMDTYSPVNLPLKNVSKGIYKGTFELPRGFHVNYKFKMLGNNQLVVEKGTDLQDIPFRHLYAMEDLVIHCAVNSWDLM